MKTGLQVKVAEPTREVLTILKEIGNHPNTPTINVIASKLASAISELERQPVHDGEATTKKLDEYYGVALYRSNGTVVFGLFCDTGNVRVVYNGQLPTASASFHGRTSEQMEVKHALDKFVREVYSGCWE